MTPDGNRGGRETNWSMTVREYLCHFPLPALAFCSLPLSFPNLSSIVCRSFFSLAVSGGRAAAISVRFISRSMRGVDRRFAAEATAGEEIPQPNPSVDEGSLIGPLVINEVPCRRALVVADRIADQAAFFATCTSSTSQRQALPIILAWAIQPTLVHLCLVRYTQLSLYGHLI